MIQWAANRHCRWPSWNLQCSKEVYIRQLKAPISIDLQTDKCYKGKAWLMGNKGTLFVPNTVHVTLCMWNSFSPHYTVRWVPTIIMPNVQVRNGGSESWITCSRSQLINSKAWIWTWTVSSKSVILTLNLTASPEHSFFWEVYSKEIKWSLEPSTS